MAIKGTVLGVFLSTLMLTKGSLGQLTTPSNAAVTTPSFVSNPSSLTTPSVTIPDGETLPSYETAVDPLLGEAVPSIHAEQLVSQCSDLSPRNRCPPNNGVPNPINFILFIEGFNGITELTEIVNLDIIMVTTWNVTTCSASTTATNITKRDRIPVFNKAQVWHPAIFFESSYDDKQMIESDIADSMDIEYNPDLPNRTLKFFWSRRGPVVASCTLDLKKFPFDDQNCTFKFSLKESIKYVYFKDLDFYGPYLSATSNWLLKSKTYWESRDSYLSDQILGRLYSSRAHFSVILKRRPDYYLFNLLTPCWVLMGLVLLGFALPMDTTDRSAFLITLLLSLYFLQSDFMGSMPATPDRLLFADYLFFLVIFTGTMLAESLVVFWISTLVAEIGEPPEEGGEDEEEESKSKSAKKNCCARTVNVCGKFEVSALRLFDLVFCLAGGFIFVLVTIAMFADASLS